MFASQYEMSKKPRALEPPPKRIGLLDHMGTGNLGDDATVDAAMQQIKRRWPDALMVGLSLDPSDTEARHGIPAFAIRHGFRCYRPALTPPATLQGASKETSALLLKNRFIFKLPHVIRRPLAIARNLMVKTPLQCLRELRFLVESFRVARSLDLLIICGGGQLLDAWGGPWQFPYTLFKWVCLAKLSHAKCYFLNVGAGPLDHPLGKWFIKQALRLADHVSFRDENSLALIEATGFGGISQVVADNVYGLELPVRNLNPDRDGSRSELVVGIAPMAYCDPRLYWDKDKATYDRYIHSLARFSASLVRSHYRLRILTTDIWFDQLAIVDLEAAIKNELDSETSPWVTCEPIDGINELLYQLSQVDCVVTSKYHGVIFAHLLNKPILAISHHLKVATLMNELGLSEYCVEIRTLDADLLRKTFDRLAANAAALKAYMPTKAASYSRAITIQFDTLFPRETSGRVHTQNGFASLLQGEAACRTAKQGGE